jgi:alpha-L-fucosidase 2
LLAPAVGRWGQLQEWAVDRDDPDSRHRHTSHLIGVYPGTRVNLVETPDLARAAAVSLEARGDTGDSRRSWTWPWRCALWSRLGTLHCHRMIDGLIEHNLLANLITTHPPLQLDGNFGITAAICEMLLQSHTRELTLLPGVDFTRWPSGYFSGLRARGGIEVSARWALGAVTSASLRCSSGDPVLLRASPAPIAAETQSGHVLPLSEEAGHVSFTPEANQLVHLRFPPTVSS